MVSTRSEPSYSHGLDVKLVIRGVFNGSVDFFDPQPRYGSCLTYNTVVNEAHLVDVLPSLKESASVEDLYKAYAAVFDRQPPRGQRMVDLVSILAASRRYLSVRMLEEMDYRRHDLEELPGWGCLFYSSNGRILTDRLLNSWLQSKPAKEYGVDVNRGHALLGMKLLREMNEAQRSGNSVVVPSKYARDFALYHQCQALSAGGLDQGVLLKQLAGAVIESITQ